MDKIAIFLFLMSVFTISAYSQNLSFEYGVESTNLKLELPDFVPGSGLLLKTDISSFSSQNTINKYMVQAGIGKDYCIGIEIMTPGKINDYSFSGDFNYTLNVFVAPESYRRTYKRVISFDVIGYGAYLKKYIDRNACLYAGLNYFVVDINERVSKSILNLGNNQNQLVYEINENHKISGVSGIIGFKYKTYLYKKLFLSGNVDINTEFVQNIDYTTFSGVSIPEISDGADLSTGSGRAGVEQGFNYGLAIGYEF